MHTSGWKHAGNIFLTVSGCSLKHTLVLLSIILRHMAKGELQNFRWLKFSLNAEADSEMW